MTELNISERMLHGPQGRIFVRQWVPQADKTSPREPIVLLHESLGCADHWRAFPGLLCRETGREVIAYDRLGFGRSDPYPVTLPYTFVQDEVNESFAVVRQSLKFKNFLACGHSVGGAMAVAIAAALQQDCRGIVTMASLSMIELQTINGVSQAKTFFSQPEQLARLRQYHGDKAEWVLNAWVVTWLAQTFQAWNLDAYLVQVQCPALVIHGEKDEYASTRHAERMVSHLGQRSSLKIMPDTGHFPHREHANDVIKEIKRFLSANLLD